MPQAAPVLNVVSPPKQCVSVSAEPSSTAEEVLSYHPEGLTLLEMSFMLSGYQEGLCFQGFQETPGPLFRHSSLLRIQLPDFRLGQGYNAGDLIFLFVFTAAKSLLNKKSDGGVKVGVSTPLA